MDEFPDAYDEYELIHEDEMDALREMDAGCSTPNRNLSLSQESIGCSILTDNEDDDTLVIDEGNTCKRQLSIESLCELNSELEIVPPPLKKHKKNISGPQETTDTLHCGVTSLRFPKWPFITFNTYHGERFYVKFKEKKDDVDITQCFTLKSPNTNLLSVSYVKLKSLAEKTLQECEQRSTCSSSKSCQLSDTEENSDLWVEKYKPKGYLELLSDEGVNRNLLNWLKKWDKIVFNKTSKKKSKFDSRNEKSKKFQNKPDGKVNNCEDGLDLDGRPQYKIALLCGPPGLGKTTLAHVIASLAGYNVVEVNASDERTTEVIHTKLEAATQMQCVLGSNRPNCLILDEIDGAPASCIEYLLNYINGRKSQKGKREKTTAGIKRPVICICNEPYVPSLRHLRQQAYVVHFPQTSSSRLAQRLLEICRKQNIKTDLSTLTLLCDKMHSDIRSCISALHFFKTKNGHIFRPSDVAKCNIGQKDLQKGLFNMWQEIFQIPVKRDGLFNSKSSASASDSCTGFSHYSSKNMERLKYLVELFHSAGDFERLQQGVHENYLKMKFQGSMESVSKGADWFCWSDMLDTYVKENQNYVLMPYLPYIFAAWHFLFSSVGFSKVSFPKAGYENHLKLVRTKQVLSDVLRGLNPIVRAHALGLQLVLDVLPMFRAILIPPLRPVNLKLFNEREKKSFAHLIDIMIDYNLNYMQHRSPDGSYYYQFDPNIEEISRFAVSCQTKLSFSYNMMQFISREVEMERVRRTESSSSVAVQDEPVEEVKMPPPKVANHLQKLTPKEVKIDASNGTQYKDFFGRIVTATSSSGHRGAKKNNPYASQMWFTYKEGFNNAVKKDITIAYLL